MFFFLFFLFFLFFAAGSAWSAAQLTYPGDSAWLSVLPRFSESRMQFMSLTKGETGRATMTRWQTSMGKLAGFRKQPTLCQMAALQEGRLSRIFFCKVVSRARAHWRFANSKIGQNPLAPPSRNLIHADKNVLPSQACGDKCVFCMCVENMRVRRVHLGGKASTYVSVMRLCAG